MNAWWWVLAMVLVGHIGLHLAIYNRLNSYGLRRRTIKQIESVFIATCLLFPVILIWGYPRLLGHIITGSTPLADIPGWIRGYGSLCLLTWPFLGIPWLITRPIFGFRHVSVESTVQYIRVANEVPVPLALTAKCQWESRFPGNQIFDLAIEEKRLPVPGLPTTLNGFRIAHLTDIHLTGHIDPAYCQYVVQQAFKAKPDLVVLTGDIVDAEHCIAWLEPCFKNTLGLGKCFFVLGNHDLRVPDPQKIRQTMEQAGWKDLGGQTAHYQTHNTSITLIGNERPWFVGPQDLSMVAPQGSMRIALCHSPDQINWARRHDIRLMLAGHTHGGQGRLPLVGPLLSPSRHGSRFASGAFYLNPTTLHVSRGLGGVHLLRLRCPPELAILSLYQPE